jgi:hypothetical protein
MTMAMTRKTINTQYNNQLGHLSSALTVGKWQHGTNGMAWHKWHNSMMLYGTTRH